ncbi:MAG: hypothetical protein PHN37_01435 [Candidatus Pacebacteria bacterium]|nr:hypothetical protein [Candidatus Paceibacterota bacterium]
MFEIDPEQIKFYLESFLNIFKTWFWVLLPFLLWKPFSFMYLWWRNEVFDSKIKKVLLEIRIPKEVLKPMRAMETVIAGIYQVLYDPPDKWEKWVEGKFQVSASLEMVSIDGIPHFFIRIPKAIKDSIEAVIYAQYPEAEITESPDYTKFIPADIPNKEWTLWGDNYTLLKRDAYPIKTYKDFETEHEVLEEKKIDPLSALLEGFNQIHEGEQIWIQIIIAPLEGGNYWKEKGQKLKDELARRPKKAEVRNKAMLIEAADLLISGTPPTGPIKEEVEEEGIIPPEMKLTPGERQILSAVENKISKIGLRTNIRFLYLGKRKSFFKARLRLVFGFFGSFTSVDLNALKPMGQPTITKIKGSFIPFVNYLKPRRLYIRQRKLFRNYTKRVTPFYPHPGGTYILSIEELATLFHFPGKDVTPAPFIERVESKKKRPPLNLPTK